MKTKKLWVVGAMGLVTVALAGQDITLQRTLTADSTETYGIETTVNQTINSATTGELPMNMTTSVTCKVKTGKVDSDKGTAAVELTTTVDKMDADGPAAGLVGKQTIPPIVQTGTIDKRGHMALDPMKAGGDFMTLAMSGAMSSTEGTLFIELPDHAIKVGDTWEEVIPKGLFTGGEDQKITEKLTGDKQVNGRDVWVVDISGKVKSDFDSSKLPSSGEGVGPLAGQQIVIKGTVDLTGEGLVDKATGQTVSLTSKGSMKSTVEIPGMSMTVDSVGTVSSVVTLK